jgi:hypothetical protein
MNRNARNVKCKIGSHHSKHSCICVAQDVRRNKETEVYTYNSYVLNFTLPQMAYILPKIVRKKKKKYWTGLFYMTEVYVHAYKFNL